MRQLGSTIECYRGEAFTIRREFVDADGAPITLPSSMRNPFARFTVKSNTFQIDGRYEKNYWCDLSNYNRVDYSEPGPPKIDTLYPTDTTLYQSNAPKVTVSNQSGQTVFTINESTNNVYISTTDATKKNFNRLAFTLANTVSDGGTGVMWLINDEDVTIEERVFEFGQEQEFIFDLRLKPHSKKFYIRIIFTDAKSSGTISISDVTGDYITNVLYYNITPDGREYYTVNYMGVGTEWEYKFELVRKFLNADTKKWIGQIYQYEIALCSGELMTDWLKKVFDTLYPNATFTPQSNDEFAHYICKKRPEILRWVNVNEPLVSYQTNKVLQGPCKLIVKEN